MKKRILQHTTLKFRNFLRRERTDGRRNTRPCVKCSSGHAPLLRSAAASFAGTFTASRTFLRPEDIHSNGLTADSSSPRNKCYAARRNEMKVMEPNVLAYAEWATLKTVSFVARSGWTTEETPSEMSEMNGGHQVVTDHYRKSARSL